MSSGSAIKVTCKDTSEKVDIISFTKGSRKMAQKGSEIEIGQMRSVIGSLGWVARQCRPDISYEVSKGQSCQAKATLDEMKHANEAVKKTQAHSDSGLYYLPGVLTWEPHENKLASSKMFVAFLCAVLRVLNVFVALSWTVLGLSCH